MSKAQPPLGTFKRLIWTIYSMKKDCIETELYTCKWECKVLFDFVGLDHVFKVTGTLWMSNVDQILNQLMDVWILTKLTWLHHGDGKEKWLAFADLHLIFKVTGRLKCQLFTKKKKNKKKNAYLHVNSLRQLLTETKLGENYNCYW